MEKYSRWTDDKNRVHVILAKWAQVEKHGEVMSLVPTTIDLLDVHNETVREVKVADFENYVSTGLLKQMLKNH